MKQSIRAILGFILSGVCLWWVLKDLSFDKFWSSLSKLDPLPMVVLVFIFVLTLWMRALRWKLVLLPIRNVKVAVCLSLMCLGYLMNNIFPARLGDIFKGIMLKKYKVPPVQGVATVFLERVLDTASLLIFFFILMLFSKVADSLPAKLLTGAGVLAGVVIFTLVIIGWAVNHPDNADKLLALVKKYLPVKLQGIIDSLYSQVMSGFQAFRNMKLLLQVVLVNISIWLVEALIPLCVMYAFKMNLGYWDALLAIIVVALSSIIPAAPGMIGVFQFVCLIVLTSLGIDKNVAVGFAFVWNLSIYTLVTVSGSLALIYEGLGLSSIRKMVESEGEKLAQ